MRFLQGEVALFGDEAFSVFLREKVPASETAEPENLFSLQCVQEMEEQPHFQGAQN